MKKIQIFDTTLRDGEQAAGMRLDIPEKVAIAKQLEQCGVDVIEAGFPVSSLKDHEAVQAVAEAVEGPVVCGLSRCHPKDIAACQQALSAAKKSRIHTGMGVSDIHLLGKFSNPRYGNNLKEKRKNVIGMSVEAVSQAKQSGTEVEFYAEDAGRTDPGFLREIVDAVVDAGAKVINLPDTTGHTVPEQYGEMIAAFVQRYAERDIVISAHCHDDLGMAVANTLAAIQNGAGQVEVTVNGIGERAGNASLEEVVMALKTRQDHFKTVTRINPQELYPTSRMVAKYMGIDVPNNKAIVGNNVFAHSSGIHVDGMIKDKRTYEIIEPESIGAPQTRIKLTARTGRNGLRYKLEENGIHVSKERFEQVYERFLNLADSKQIVEDEELKGIVSHES